MRDTEFYEALLGITDSWRVTKVALDSSAGRVDVWIEDHRGIKWKCPEWQYYRSGESSIGAVCGSKGCRNDWPQ